MKLERAQEIAFVGGPKLSVALIMEWADRHPDDDVINDPKIPAFRVSQRIRGELEFTKAKEQKVKA